MNKQILIRCFWVSFIMSLALPIVTTEIYTTVHGIDERYDYAEIRKAQEKGTFDESEITGYMRKITGFERVTHRFADWYSFLEYLKSVLHWFVILLVATLIAASGRPESDPS